MSITVLAGTLDEFLPEQQTYNTGDTGSIWEK
jgi:hypothetical protein